MRVGLTRHHLEPGVLEGQISVSLPVGQSGEIFLGGGGVMIDCLVQRV